MHENSSGPSPETNRTPPSPSESQGRAAGARQWWPYVLPWAVFAIVGALEPSPAGPSGGGSDQGLFAVLRVDDRYYPLVYAIKIALTLAAMAAAWPMYRRFEWRLTRWAAPAGVIGAGVWIGLCRLRLEPAIFQFLGLDSWADLGQRGGFNPLAEMADRPALAYAFLSVRFLGLALVVPVIEEFFLRGLLARVIVHPNWWEVPFGQVNGPALLGLTVFPLLVHPAGEAIATLVWFSGITWLMVRTRTIWDCVVAHAITNMLLGAYVVASGDWRLL